MEAVRIDDGIFRMGVNITEPGYLFEGLWPIPDGTSINSYLVKADKTAIIDLTQDIADFPETLEKQLEGTGVTPGDLDYIIVNHMEPDHSGFLGKFRQHAPNAEILCSEKAVPLIKEFAGVTENVRAVADGETLDLGGRTLQFFMAPNVHWPETMVTYETARKVLFSCDAFGSYGKVEGRRKRGRRQRLLGNNGAVRTRRCHPDPDAPYVRGRQRRHRHRPVCVRVSFICAAVQGEHRAHRGEPKACSLPLHIVLTPR